MDPSRDSIFSSFGPNQPVISVTQPTHKKSKKWVAIMLVIIIILAIGGGVLWFFSSRTNAKNSIEILHASLDWIYDDVPQCYDLISYADNISVSTAEYDALASNCLEETSAARNHINNTSILFVDNEYAKLQKALASEFESLIIAGQKLHDAVTIYQTWHKWFIASTDPLLTATDHDLENTAKILTESDNETLAKFGTDWLDARKKLLNASVLAEINPAAANSQKALAEYNNFLQSSSPSLSDLTGLNAAADYSSLADSLTNLYNYAEANL